MPSTTHAVRVEMSENIDQQIDVRNPVAAWILATLIRRYRDYEPNPVDATTLAIELCEKSFDSMKSDGEFLSTLDTLLKAKLITHQTHNQTKAIGYVVSPLGVIVFRRQIAGPFEKFGKRPDELSQNPKFKKAVDVANSSADLLRKVAELCRDNAPLVIEFIRSVKPN